MTVVLSDVMPDVRYFLRHHPDLAPLHDGRVFFRIPENQTVWPLVRIYRSGGSLQPGSDAPVSDVNVSIECWSNGPPQRNGFDYASARQLATAIESALFQIDGNTLLNPSGSTVCWDVNITAVIDQPDPETGWPRLVVDTRWTVLPLSS